MWSIGKHNEFCPNTDTMWLIAVAPLRIRHVGPVHVFHRTNISICGPAIGNAGARLTSDGWPKKKKKNKKNKINKTGNKGKNGLRLPMDRMGRWTWWAELAQWELIDALNNWRTATGGWVVRLQLPQDENVAEAEDEDAETLCRWLANCRVSKPKKKKKRKQQKTTERLRGGSRGVPGSQLAAHASASASVWNSVSVCISVLAFSACVNISPSYLCHTAHKAGQLDNWAYGHTDLRT